MYYVIKFYLKHYRASRSSYKSRKVRRISSKNARFCPFFLFLQPFLIRVGPVINMFRLRNISTSYFKCFRVCGSGYYGRGRVRKTPRGSYFGNSRTKKQVITYLYAKVNSLVQANLSVDRADFGIRLKIRLCTMR